MEDVRDLEPIRLLLVDGYPEREESLRVGLRQMDNWEVDVVNEAHQAVNARFRYPYVVIIWDYRTVPDVEEAVWKIRTLEKDNGWFPVSLLLIVEQFNHAEDNNYKSTGVNDYIFVPVCLEELKDKLMRWLSVPHLQQGLLNIETVRELVEIDDSSREMMQSLLEILRKETPVRITKLITLNREGELQLAAEVAHSLKSGCLSLGMAYFAKICEEIEQGYLAGLTASPTLLDRLSRVYEESYTALEESIALL